MWFSLRSIDLTYASQAPFSILNEADLPAPPERVWAVLQDGDAWLRWFKDAVSTHWTSAPPHGVGSTRELKLKLASAKETFLLWEPGRRCAYRVDAATAPLVSAMMEDIQITPSAGGGTHLSWRVSYTPRPIMRLIHPIARMIFGGMFRSSLVNLGRYLSAHQT